MRKPNVKKIKNIVKILKKEKKIPFDGNNKPFDGKMINEVNSAF